jgi:hypothetical protein
MRGLRARTASAALKEASTNRKKKSAWPPNAPVGEHNA